MINFEYFHQLADVYHEAIESDKRMKFIGVINNNIVANISLTKKKTDKKLSKY